MTMVDEGATESLSARFHREHRERRLRMFEARLKKTPIKAEIETVVSEPIPPYGDPVEVITKEVAALHRFDLHNGNPSMSLLLRCCAREYDVSQQDLISERRAAPIVRPRQIAMYLARKMTARSLPEIGQRFGGRDHTTVLHAVRKIERLIASDVQLAGRVARIKTTIEEAVAEATRADRERAQAPAFRPG